MGRSPWTGRPPGRLRHIGQSVMIVRLRVPPLADGTRGIEAHRPGSSLMARPPSARIQDHFADLTDPRRREGTYPLINFVVIALCAVVAGADDFVAIAAFGKARRDWLARFLDLSAGIPSHDRFNAILASIKPAEFEACLLSWITAL